MKKIFFLVLTLTVLFFPFFSSADEMEQDSYDIRVVDQDDDLVSQIEVNYEGLVPCGRCLDADNSYNENLDEWHGCESGTHYIPCTLCHGFIIFDRIISFILVIIASLAMVMIVASGVYLITSSGDSEKITKAKKILISTTGGLILALVAWNLTALMINQFMNTDDYEMDWTSGGIQIRHMCQVRIEEIDFEE